MHLKNEYQRIYLKKIALKVMIEGKVDSKIEVQEVEEEVQEVEKEIQEVEEEVQEVEEEVQEVEGEMYSQGKTA